MPAPRAIRPNARRETLLIVIDVLATIAVVLGFIMTVRDYSYQSASWGSLVAGPTVAAASRTSLT